MGRILLFCIAFIVTNIRAQEIVQADTIVKEEPALCRNPDIAESGVNKTWVVKDDTYERPGFEPFSFNHNGAGDGYPSISSDGLRMYFSHNQNKDWMFFCSRNSVSEDWSVPVPVEIYGLGETYDESNANIIRLLTISFGSDDQTVYISGAWGIGMHLAKLRRIDNSWVKFEFETDYKFQSRNGTEMNVSFITNMSFCNNDREMYCYMGSGISKFIQATDGIWSEVEEIGEHGDFMGRVLPDGLHFITSIGSDHKRPSNQLWLLKRSSFSQSFNECTPVVILNRPDLTFFQPSASIAAGKIALVENHSGDWNHNNIYFVPLVLDGPTAATEIKDLAQTPKTDNAILSVQVVPGPGMSVTPVVSLATPTNPAMPSGTKTELRTNSGIEAYSLELGNPFPNPASNTIYFYYRSKGSEIGQFTTAEVVDLTGKTAISKSIDTGNGEAALDISSLAPGTYMLRIGIAGLQTASKKFVVVR